MYTPRQLQLFSLLMSKQADNTLSALADTLSVSDKTVKYEIETINASLPGDQSIHYVYGNGYSLDNIQEDILTEIALAVDQTKGKEIRRSASIIVTLLFETDYITMETVGHRLYLSKSAVRKEFEKCWWLREYIEVSHQKGLRICIPESEQRYLLTEFFSKDSGLPALVGLEEEYDQLIQVLKPTVESAFLKYNYIVSGESSQKFYTFLMVCILRRHAGFVVEKPGTLLQISPLLQSLQTSIRRISRYTLTQDELCYCQQLLQGLNFIYAESPKSPYSLDCSRYKKIYSTFISRVYNDLSIDISLPTVQQEALCSHLQKAESRVISRHQFSNLYKRELNRKYPLTAHIAAEYLNPLLNPDMKDAEFSHIIPYFTAVENRDEPMAAVLLSRQHPGLLHQMALGLQSALRGEISDIQIAPLYQYEKIKKGHDIGPRLIFTTENEILIKFKDSLLVKPIMDSNDLFNTALQARQYIIKQRKKILHAAERRYIKKDIFRTVLGNYNSLGQLLSLLNLTPIPYTYEIVLDVNLAFLPRFLLGCGKNEIQVFVLQKPFRHRGRLIEAVISTVCDPALGDTRAFYSALCHLISPKFAKKAVHFFSD